MVSLVTIKNALFKKLQGDPGKSVYVDTLGDGGGEDNAVIYFPSGFFSSPHDGIEGVKVDTGEHNIIVGTQNYKLNITLDKGEAKIFSYDADGVVLSEVKCDSAGLIVLKNDVEDLKTLINDLIIEIKAITTTGSPTSQVVSPASQALLDAVDARFNSLLGDS